MQNSNKPSIAVVCDKAPSTSFGRLAQDTCKALAPYAQTHLLWLTTPRYFSEGTPKPLDGLVHHSEWSIAAPNQILGWQLWRKPLLQMLAHQKIDHVLVIRPELGFLVPLLQRTLPACKIHLWIHDVFAQTLYPNSLKFALIKKFFIAPSRLAHTFLYNSLHTLNEAARVMKIEGNGTIVGCPIDTQAFPKSTQTRAELRQALGLQDWPALCLNISLDEPRKNVDTFLHLAQQRPDIAFCRIGPHSARLQNLATTLGLRNYFTRHGIDHATLVQWYQAADLFIYPSWCEGFGMPPLEAMACGTPVVSARNSALVENLEGICPLADPADNLATYLSAIDAVVQGKPLMNWPQAQKLLATHAMESFAHKLVNHFRLDV